jgi:hypothetical protein
LTFHKKASTPSEAKRRENEVCSQVVGNFDISSNFLRANCGYDTGETETGAHRSNTNNDYR